MQRLLVEILLHFVAARLLMVDRRKRPLLWGEGTIERHKKLLIMYLSDLYNHDKITDVEELNELVDSVIIKIIEEYHSFEAIRACSVFHHNRPNIGKNIPIYRDCINYISKLATHVHMKQVSMRPIFPECWLPISKQLPRHASGHPVAKLLKIPKIFVGSGDQINLLRSASAISKRTTRSNTTKTPIQFTNPNKSKPKMMSKTMMSIGPQSRRSIRLHPKPGFTGQSRL